MLNNFYFSLTHIITNSTKLENFANSFLAPLRGLLKMANGTEIHVYRVDQGKLTIDCSSTAESTLWKKVRKVSSYVLVVPATICGMCLKGLMQLDNSERNVNDKIKEAQREVAQISSRANITNLSRDLLCHLMGFFDNKDIAKCLVLNKDSNRKLRNVPNDLRVLNTQYESMAIAAKRKWETYFGEIGEIPPLPKDIHTVLGSPCPFDPSKKVVETHMLMLIPATVNRQPLTLNSLRALVKHPKQGNATDYDYVNDRVLAERGNVTIGPSYWALMTKDVIPGSRSKNYAVQQTLVRKDLGYDVPNFFEAAVCILMEYVSTGVQRYGRGNVWTYTRCQEQVSGYQIVVGGFAPSGLYVRSFSDYHSGYNFVGVAAMRKFVS